MAAITGINPNIHVSHNINDPDALEKLKEKTNQVASSLIQAISVAALAISAIGVVIAKTVAAASNLSPLCIIVGSLALAALLISSTDSSEITDADREKLEKRDREINDADREDKEAQVEKRKSDRDELRISGEIHAGVGVR